MWYKEDNFTVIIGGIRFTRVPIPLEYKGQRVFTFSRAENTEDLGIDFEIYDSNRKKIATIKRGRIYTGDKDKFKIDKGADTWTLYGENNEVLCSISKRSEASGAELKVTAKMFLSDGLLFDAKPDVAYIGTNKFVGISMTDCMIGISIG